MVGRRRRLSAIAAFRLYSDQCDWIGRPRCARQQPTFVTRSASTFGRTILRQRAGLARFTADQHLPRDEDGPVFAEPWQAEAFALTVRLHEAGCFIWPEGAGAIA